MRAEASPDTRVAVRTTQGASGAHRRSDDVGALFARSSVSGTLSERGFRGRRLDRTPPRAGAASHPEEAAHADRPGRHRTHRRLPRGHAGRPGRVSTSLVVADADPGRAAAVAAAARRRVRRGPGRLFGAGLDALVIAAATDAHAAWSSPPSRPACRRSARSRSRPTSTGTLDRARQGRRRRTCRCTSASSAASTRATRPRARRSESGELGWVHTLRAGTLDPAAAARGLHRRLGRLLPRLLGARLRHPALGHRP